MSQYKIPFADLPWEHPMQGLRFKAHKQGDTQLRMVEFAREMPMQICEKGHIGMVLVGRLEITFEGGKEVFEPGDGIFIPNGPEHWHMGRPLTDVVRMILVETV